MWHNNLINICSSEFQVLINILSLQGWAELGSLKNENTLTFNFSLQNVKKRKEFANIHHAFVPVFSDCDYRSSLTVFHLFFFSLLPWEAIWRPFTNLMDILSLLITPVTWYLLRQIYISWIIHWLHIGRTSSQNRLFRIFQWIKVSTSKLYLERR